jgi:hypothetical protein
MHGKAGQERMMASQKTGHERFTAGAKPGESVLSVILASHNAFNRWRPERALCMRAARRRSWSRAAQEINGNHFPRAKAQLVE